MVDVRTKHRLTELETQNAALLARVEALEVALAAWLPPSPEEIEEERENWYERSGIPMGAGEAAMQEMEADLQ